MAESMSLQAQAEQLKVALSEAIRSNLVSAMPERMRQEFRLSAQALLLQCHAEEFLTPGADPSHPLPEIGNFWSYLGQATWNDPRKTFELRLDPASPEAILDPIESARKDLMGDLPLVTYKSPTYMLQKPLSNPPSNDDLVAIGEHISLISSGYVLFEHSCPDLDLPLTPAVAALLKSERYYGLRCDPPQSGNSE